MTLGPRRSDAGHQSVERRRADHVVFADRKARGARLTMAGRRFVDRVADSATILDHGIKAGTRRGNSAARLGQIKINLDIISLKK